MRKVAFYTIASAVILYCASAFAQDKLSVDDLLKKHLDSIGTAEARSATKIRAASGKFTVEVIQGGVGQGSGDAGVISAGKMVKLLMKTDATFYPGDRFWFDGKKVVVPVVDVNARTYLADFVYRNESILRDGIFCGAIGTSWALLDVKDRGAKLIYDGLKTMDGVQLHQLTYIPRKSASELEVQMFFDPQTFRHVMTRYKFEVAGYLNVTAGIDRQARSSNTTKAIYRVEERFSDFKTADGVTLPATWDIRYSVEPVRTIMLHWNVSLTRVTPNPSVDLKTIFPEQ